MVICAHLAFVVVLRACSPRPTRRRCNGGPCCWFEVIGWGRASRARAQARAGPHDPALAAGGADATLLASDDARAAGPCVGATATDVAGQHGWARLRKRPPSAATAAHATTPGTTRWCGGAGRDSSAGGALGSSRMSDRVACSSRQAAPESASQIATRPGVITRRDVPKRRPGPLLLARG